MLKALKPFLLLYLTALFLLLGYGIAKSFLRDFSLFDSPYWFYFWPFLSALLFAFSGISFWRFIENIKRK